MQKKGKTLLSTRKILNKYLKTIIHHEKKSYNILIMSILQNKRQNQVMLSQLNPDQITKWTLHKISNMQSKHKLSQNKS